MEALKEVGMGLTPNHGEMAHRMEIALMGGGGSSYNAPFNCMDGLSVWGNVPPGEKKKALQALEQLYI